MLIVSISDLEYQEKSLQNYMETHSGKFAIHVEQSEN